MISTNTLSIFLLYHDHNGIFIRNIHSVQDFMHAIYSSNKNFKPVCKYFLNIFILYKSAMPEKVRLIFVHMYVEKNPLGNTLLNFADRIT